MRLLRLRLTNFRQHLGTEILFAPGLTGIIGPNGAGKSTLLEAIAWAIYGSGAARGTNETLRFSGAPAGSAVRVELDFRLDDDVYRVSRTLKGADLFLGESLQPIASGLTTVSEVVTRRLGMSRDEFFHTYFTGQRELQFLATMRPAERGRFLSQVLGYERLRAAQERARVRRNALAAEVRALESALGDQEALARAAEEAERRAEKAQARAAEAEKEVAEAARRVDAEAPRWKALEAKRERDQTLAADLRVSETEAAEARKAMEEALAELEALEAMAAQWAEMRRPLEQLAAVVEEAERWAALREAETTRALVTRHIEDVTADLKRRAARVAQLEKTAAVHEEDARALAELKKVREALGRERDRLRTEWARERQEADTQLRTLGDRARELGARIESLEKAGPDGVCPTCARPLGQELDRVLETLRSELESVTQDGRWWRKRQAQLKKEPAPLREAEARAGQVERELEAAEGRLGRSKNAAQDLERERREGAEREKALANLRAHLAKLPEGYDADRHRAHVERLNGLRRLQEEAARLETRLERKPVLAARRREAEGRLRGATEGAARLRAERAALGYSESEHEEARAAHERAQAALHEAALRLERARAEAEAALEAAERARAAREEQARRARTIEDSKRLLRQHEELDRALGQLRDDLNARVRPELSEIAGAFLVELTDGRYNEIVIDDDYNVLVLDDGVPKPVLSGGEEDIANLVLRLAVSQMIADRAGQSLHLLIFDEIFGGLDEARRENVVRLLQRLLDRFEQVILISHIEAIRDGLDQVIRVRYDERTGASVVTEERPEHAAPALEPAAT